MDLVRDQPLKAEFDMVRRSVLCSGRVLLGRVLLLAGTMMFSACGDSSGDHPPVYPVRGQVLSKGKPLPGGLVVFELDAPGKVNADGTKEGPLRASAKISNDGRFSMNGYAGAEGMPVGKYKVSVSNVVPRSEKGLLSGEAPSVSKANAVKVNRNYADLSTSGLQTEVVADKPNEPTFDLK